MIKRNNKKGFTIVELVIVIAVIAILAAVLIPTFSGIVKKAQLSSDQQAVRNMNIAIVASRDLADINAVIDALAENGFNSKKALIPVSTGLAFYWNPEAKAVCLVKEEDKSVVFPDEGYTFADTWTNLEASVKYLDIAASDVATLEEALVTGNDTIKLEADITLKNQVMIPADAKVTLDLNGKTITTEQVTGRSKYLDVAGELTIVNGTIKARGIEVMDGGKLVIGKDAKVAVSNVDANGGACLWIYAGGEVVVDGGTFTATNGNNDGNLETADPGVINNSGTITINDGTFTNSGDCYAIINNDKATMTINGGNFTGNRGVVAAQGGTVVINGGTFTVTGESPIPAHVVYADDGNVTINGGTFTNNGGASCYDFCVDGGGTGSIKIGDTTLTAGKQLND
jgi:prepilin-type N-terminal cleavage/methylation domain-containing protein